MSSFDATYDAANEPGSEWWARYMRMSASPGTAVALARMNDDVDIRALLPSIQVPTLILHRSGDLVTAEGGARWMAAQIRGAKYIMLSGNDHIPWFGDQDALLDEIEEFLTGVRRGPEPDRMLATVLFTDIAGSTERAAAVGDRRWRELLEAHHRVIRGELARYRGREVDTAGDGFLAVFDGPARAVRCATAAAAIVRELGLEIRAGVHTGEVEVMGSSIGGIAVHIGARVASLAQPGEVLVSSTVKDLVAGSGIEFRDRGTHILKGVPGEWRVFAATV